MLITSVKVRALYGLHNYEIDFNKDTSVKIIHAPNGYGKTTILKLIRSVISGDFEAIKQVLFDIFEICFEDELCMHVAKKGNEIVYEITDLEGTHKYVVGSEIEGDTSEHLLERLKEVQGEVPIYFIDANRLWFERKDYKDEEKVYLPTVLEYARELSEWMREALAQSNFCGQELDRSFPNRLAQMLTAPSAEALTAEEIEEALKVLENKRTILQGAGLFSNKEEETPKEIVHLDENMRKVLTLYIEDSQAKLKVFETLATKINLLCSLINKRFSYKIMEVNMKEGFVFKVPSHEKLKADKLSSGEQNELILMFMLLFKAPSHAFILMDEPEISLHIAWQQSFLEDMEAIAKLSNIRLLIATHSPDIINGRWDLATGLEEET